MMATCKMQGSIQKCPTINNGNFKDKAWVAKIKSSVVIQPHKKVIAPDFRTKLPEFPTSNSVATTNNPLFIETPNNYPNRTTQPDSAGKFGRFGGKFVPETLIVCLNQLEAEFNKVMHDKSFQEELAEGLRDYVGRETPLYHARRLSEYYKTRNGGEGPDIFLKREDLTHGGSHKMNNALAQVMLANRIGRKHVITATAAGRHGVATASACAKLGLECTVFMGTRDMEQYYCNVELMKMLGAQVEGVNGSFKDAASESIRRWVGDLDNSYHLTGTAVGPHPCPTMVRHFQSVIGKETRKQALDRWGGKPDALVACVASGSNALGLFHEFIGDDDVRLVGVEAAGFGLDSGRHASTLCRGEVGVYHGAMSYLLQDEDGQVVVPHSVAVGMQYPGVGPELSFLKETGRAEFYSATDQEAIDAYERLCKLEGIIASLEASHALAILDKLVPTLGNGRKVVVNCCGEGDKDVAIVLKHKQFDGQLQRTNLRRTIAQIDQHKKDTRVPIMR